MNALESYLWAPDGGDYKAAYLQAGSWLVDRTRDTAANAVLQRANATLARCVEQTGR